MKADEDVCSILIDLVADFWVGLEESVDKSITKKKFHSLATGSTYFVMACSMFIACGPC